MVANLDLEVDELKAVERTYFPTPVLDRQWAQQREQWERDRQTVLSAAQTWLISHAEEFGIKQGYLFGSVIQAERFSNQSDLDIAVDTLSVGDPFGLASYLSLQVNRDVDVVPLDQCHFADKIRQIGRPWSTTKSPDSELS